VFIELCAIELGRAAKARGTSSNPTARDNAAPVERSALFWFPTGQGSRWSSSRMDVRVNSHCWMGRRNLVAPKPGVGTDDDWLGLMEERPSSSWTCLD